MSRHASTLEPTNHLTLRVPTPPRGLEVAGLYTQVWGIARKYGSRGSALYHSQNYLKLLKQLQWISKTLSCTTVLIVLILGPFVIGKRGSIYTTNLGSSVIVGNGGLWRIGLPWRLMPTSV